MSELQVAGEGLCVAMATPSRGSALLLRCEETTDDEGCGTTSDLKKGGGFLRCWNAPWSARPSSIIFTNAFHSLQELFYSSFFTCLNRFLPLIEKLDSLFGEIFILLNALKHAYTTRAL